MSGASVLSASKIIGTPVTNPAGENLGKIEDIVIDLEMGVISYAVLSFGGFMGMGNKLFAIPWQAMKQSDTEEKFRLDVKQESLKSAEGFDKDNWPEMDRNWDQQVHDYYDIEPYWKRENISSGERESSRR